MLPLEDLDSDDAADRPDRGECHGEQPVGCLAAQDGDEDQHAEDDEADPVAEAEDEGLVLEAGREPKEEQARE